MGNNITINVNGGDPNAIVDALRVQPHQRPAASTGCVMEAYEWRVDFYSAGAWRTLRQHSIRQHLPRATATD
jgi:hypothetical protein